MTSTEGFVRNHLKVIKQSKKGLVVVFPDSIPRDGRKDSGDVRL